MHLTAQKGGKRGNRIEFTNTEGCDQEDEVYLLQNKLEYLNLFEAGSTKQAQIDYTALIQFIDSLSGVMKKEENKLIYYRLGILLHLLRRPALKLINCSQINWQATTSRLSTI